MIGLLVMLVVFGAVLYLVEAYVPMSPPVKTVLRVLVVLFLILYLLRAFGLVDGRMPAL